MEHPPIGVGTLNISAKAKAYVMDALNNNRLSYGPYCRRFERDFARIHGVKFAVLSNSGTSALHVALGVLKEMHGWQDGDEVLVPAVTFVATVNIVLHNRMMPVLVDVDRDYYEIDPEKIEARITPRTRAIIPVHLFGQPADMDPIRAIAARHNLKIIEDSAETMFARYRGKFVGGLGDIGCFSTYIAHLLTTGVGGFTTTNDPDYAVRLRSLVNHGRDSIYISIDDDDNLSDEELKMIIERRFSFISVGHSFRITEMEAALGVAQLDDWQTMVAARRSNAATLTDKLTPFSDRMQLPAIRPGCEHSFMMYPIVLRDLPKRELVNFLELRGIETRDMLPLTNQPVYKKLLGIRDEDYPVARWINDSGFYIASHQDLKDADLDYIGEVFTEYWRGALDQRARPTATLIMLVNDAWRPLDRVFDDVPAELFDEIILLNTGAASDRWDAFMARTGAQLHSVPYQQAARAVIDGTIPVRGENIVFFCANGRQDVGDVGRLLQQLNRGYDMVIASRFLPGGARRGAGSATALRSTGNRFFTLLGNLMFPGNITDALTTFRAVRRARLQSVRPGASLLGSCYHLTLHALRAQWNVGEIATIEAAVESSAEMRAAYKSVVPLLGVLLRERWLARRGRRRRTAGQ